MNLFARQGRTLMTAATAAAVVAAVRQFTAIPAQRHKSRRNYQYRPIIEDPNHRKNNFFEFGASTDAPIYYIYSYR